MGHIETIPTEYDIFRESYIRDLNNGLFPFEAAYYHYSETTTRIDVLTFQDFKEKLTAISQAQNTNEEKWQNVSAPIYEKLDELFKPKKIYDEQSGKLLKVV